MVPWLDVMWSLSSSSLFQDWRDLSTNLENFPARSLYPLMVPRDISSSNHVGFSSAKETKLISKLTTNTRGTIPLQRKDTCYYRNTLYMNKNRVPAGDSLGRLLGSPREAPPFEPCRRHCLSVLWPWRAAQPRRSVATVLIVR